MFQQVIDRATGALFLKDGYSVSPDQSEADLAAHFKLPLQPESEWGGAHYYFIESAADECWKLNMNLAFFHHQLRFISLYPIIPAELLQLLDSERKGFGPSEKEYAMLEIYENWLTAQLEKERKFSWGSIEALFAPRPDGPGEPLIHLMYE